MALVYPKSPLFPTMYFEYKQIRNGLQGFFFDLKREKRPFLPCFSSNSQDLKHAFDNFPVVNVKLEKPPGTTSCARGLSFCKSATKYGILQKSFRHYFVIFYKILGQPTDYGLLLLGQALSPSSAARSLLPSSLSRCSCILATEALRNWTRDCFTSSRAAWTASSVRARASSAYSFATW